MRYCILIRLSFFFPPWMKQIYSVVKNITWMLLDGHSVHGAWKPETRSRINAETEMELHKGEKCSQKNSVNPQQRWCGVTGGSLLNTLMSSDRIAVHFPPFCKSAKCHTGCVLGGTVGRRTVKVHVWYFMWGWRWWVSSLVPVQLPGLH